MARETSLQASMRRAGWPRLVLDRTGCWERNKFPLSGVRRSLKLVPGMSANDPGTDFKVSKIDHVQLRKRAILGAWPRNRKCSPQKSLHPSLQSATHA